MKGYRLLIVFSRHEPETGYPTSVKWSALNTHVY